MGDYSVISKFTQAVKAIKALDGIADDELVLGAIDALSASIVTFVSNTASVREKTIAPDVVETIEPDAPEN